MTTGDITQTLQRIEAGEQRAADQLMPLVYEELRRLATVRMAGEAPGHTLQPTALVHEAWLRLGLNDEQHWNGRTHFFAAAAEAMRRILIDSARRRLAQRRGGGKEHLDVANLELAAPTDDAHLLQVNEALEKFAAADPKKAELVKLRFFGGLTIPEAAQALEIAEPTANRWWAYARAWFIEELSH